VPEGDTVWRAARRLNQALAGARVESFELRVPQLATVDLRGDTVEEVIARGKHLLMRFGSQQSLHSHLRMDGSWRIGRPGERIRGGPQYEIRALVGSAQWVAAGFRVHDLALLPTAREDEWVGHLGPDVLGPDWDADEALRRLRAQPERAVAEALLDQRNLAGVGNLYKCETLFVTRTWPWTPVGEVADLPKVVTAAHKLLNANREHPEQATTGSLRADERHWVYRRDKRPCRRCRTPIAVAMQGDPPYARATYWCPRCQPQP
jgi:endonuclease VIII